VGLKLNALDLAFLALETQKTPVNVASVSLFRIPPGYQGNYVRDLLGELVKQPAGRPFNLRLSSTGIGPNLQWIIDRHFDIDYHVRHSALPAPGTVDDLMALVSRLHSRVMDRERPLWEFHIIEGLQDDRFAVYMKMHHAAIDGMGGIEILESCFSPDAGARARAPWSGLAKKSKPKPELGLISTVMNTAKQLKRQVEMGQDIGKLLLGHGLKGMGLKPADSPVPFTAPKSLFNVPISGARKFAARTLSLSDLKSVGRLAHATVNDVLLAVCAGALRRYLLEKKALPDRSLIASVPVSVRQINRSGNQITYVAAKLATDADDPVERLVEIGKSTMQAKREVAGVSAMAATTFAVMAQGLVAVLNRLKISEWLPPPANVTISNVPGPRKALYFGGAELLSMYPLSVLIDGQALNITVMSYRNSVDFGLMACRDSVPDVELIGDYIEHAFLELGQAVIALAKDEKQAVKPRQVEAKKKLRQKKIGSKKTIRKKFSAVKPGIKKKTKAANWVGYWLVWSRRVMAIISISQSCLFKNLKVKCLLRLLN